MEGLARSPCIMEIFPLNSVKYELWDQLYNKIADRVWNQDWDQVYNKVVVEVDEGVGSNVWTQVVLQVRKQP
jgi:hypothetical protein